MTAAKEMWPSNSKTAYSANNCIWLIWKYPGFKTGKEGLLDFQR